MEVFQPTNPNSLPWSLGCSITGTCFLPSSPLSPSPLLTELQVHRLGWPFVVWGKRLSLGLCMFCSLFLKHTTPTLSLPKSKLSPKAPLQCHILREALLRARVGSDLPLHSYHISYLSPMEHTVVGSYISVIGSLDLALVEGSRFVESFL